MPIGQLSCKKNEFQINVTVTLLMPETSLAGVEKGNSSMLAHVNSLFVTHTASWLHNAFYTCINSIISVHLEKEKMRRIQRQDCLLRKAIFELVELQD